MLAPSGRESDRTPLQRHAALQREHQRAALPLCQAARALPQQLAAVRVQHREERGHVRCLARAVRVQNHLLPSRRRLSQEERLQGSG